MKYILLFLCFKSSAQMVIDGEILAKRFGDIKNDNFIEVTEENNIAININPSYQFYYPENAPVHFTFLDYNVKDAKFRVTDEIIEAVELEFEVFDIEEFYLKVVDRYGEAGTSSTGAEYLKMHGFKLPTEFDGPPDPNYYDSLPQPKVADYKMLRSTTWYDINKDIETAYMGIRTRKSLEIMDTTTYDVIIFLKVGEL